MMQSPLAGRIFVLSGPSGVGKGTLCKRLLQELPRLKLSVSATSRPKRPQEQESVDYYFLTRQQFEQAIQEDAFLEWAQYNGQYYGTLREAVLQILQAGDSVLLEIDTQGALQVKQRYPQAILIFVSPPSLEELERRLRGRATNEEEDIQRRLTITREELALQPQFDRVIVNDHFEQALQGLKNMMLEKIG